VRPGVRFQCQLGHCKPFGYLLVGLVLRNLCKDQVPSSGRRFRTCLRTFAAEAIAEEVFEGVGPMQVRSYPVHQGVRCIALVKGDVSFQARVPLRIHSECLLGDVFRAQRCQCGRQLQKFLDVLGSRGSRPGLLLYLQGHEGKGIGLANKLRAYALQDGPEKLSEERANIRLGFKADERKYGAARNVLVGLQIGSVVLYTSNRQKMAGISTDVAAVVPWSAREQRWLDDDIR